MSVRSEMENDRQQERQHLKKLLSLRKSNLYRLEEQVAQHGISVPIHILSGIDNELLHIQDIESRLQFLDQIQISSILGNQLLSAMSSDLLPPKPFADPNFIKNFETPGGAIALQSRFYVKRDYIDDRLYEEITKPTGTTTTIRGPRQVGKTSLLIRANDVVNQTGRPTVYIDLQEIDGSQLENLDKFLFYLAATIVEELSLELTQVEKAWQSPYGPSRKINNLLEDYLLPTIDVPLVLIMDEVDKLFDSSFHDDFFGLVRAWHNRRARKSLWHKFHIIMVISTDMDLLIQNPNQSL